MLLREYLAFLVAPERQEDLPGGCHSRHLLSSFAAGCPGETGDLGATIAPQRPLWMTVHPIRRRDNLHRA